MAGRGRFVSPHGLVRCVGAVGGACAAWWIVVGAQRRTAGAGLAWAAQAPHVHLSLAEFAAVAVLHGSAGALEQRCRPFALVGTGGVTAVFGTFCAVRAACAAAAQGGSTSCRSTSRGQQCDALIRMRNITAEYAHICTKAYKAPQTPEGSFGRKSLGSSPTRAVRFLFSSNAIAYNFTP